MTIRTQRDPTFLTLPGHIAVSRAFVAHPEIVVCAVVGDFAPFVAGALGGSVGEDSGGHC